MHAGPLNIRAEFRAAEDVICGNCSLEMKKLSGEMPSEVHLGVP